MITDFFPLTSLLMLCFILAVSTISVVPMIQMKKMTSITRSLSLTKLTWFGSQAIALLRDQDGLSSKKRLPMSKKMMSFDPSLAPDETGGINTKHLQVSV